MYNNQRHSTSIRQSVQLKIDPRVVLSGQLLELNSVELKSAIEAEMQENPALDWLDDGSDGIGDDEILASVAPGELAHGSDDYEFRRSLPNDTESFDWLDLAASNPSLEEHLEAQLCSGEPIDNDISRILIASLDERGYLTQELEEIALDHNADLDRVYANFERLQKCEPPGVGARNLQECLLLQLYDAKGIEKQLARDIIANHFDLLIDREVKALCRKFKTLPDLIHAALKEIQQLTPYPIDSFHRDQHYRPSSKSVAVPVELVITRHESGWEVQLKGTNESDLIVNREYQNRLAALKDRRGDDEKRHYVVHVNRAQQFIDSIRQRNLTLLRIGRYVVERQQGFVSTGDYAFLKPLTRRKMAQDLEIHESTISRATAGKHLQLANGEVISFEVLFKPALRVQQMISEILSTEDPDRPYSDERIAKMLEEKGVHIARRTVNKYRDRTKLLSSRRRRSA